MSDFRMPLVRSTYWMLHRKFEYYRLRWTNPERVFTEIYKGNKWGGRDSRSGVGSDESQTRVLVKELAGLLVELEVSTVLDIPCGDFHWMRDVDLNGADYTGADIVDRLVRSNTEKYGRDGVWFRKLDLIRDRLPKVDLILCRDCLVHLCFADIVRALDNICDSRSGFLLTTTFTERRENHDIATGQWRFLNLEAAPFTLPRPLKVINEGCTEGEGVWGDKSLGLWRIADIREGAAIAANFSGASALRRHASPAGSMDIDSRSR